jgi:hypothetical protein
VQSKGYNEGVAMGFGSGAEVDVNELDLPPEDLEPEPEYEEGDLAAQVSFDDNHLRAHARRQAADRV